MGLPAIDHTTPQTIEDLFARLDADGDGHLDAVELQAMLRALGQPHDPESARRLIAILDRAGTGRIDFDTFRRFAAGQLPAPDPDAELRATFRVLDRDGDGYLSTDDMAQASDIARHEARAMVRAADTDGDGRLSFREFRNAVTGPDPSELEDD